ncbi:class I SAM-dependent methyltransferase [candidate division WOR-3 bacterium]|nr:class I SAM-dependent methyltransferase [candidate division WOR-3 bacterium]
MKARLPFLVPLWRRARYSGKSPERVFTDEFRRNRRVWKGRGSSSGPGSSLAQTAAVRRALPGLLKELGCRSLLDAPCGDFFWMRHVDLGVDYTGGDIVEKLVEENRRRYGRPGRRFVRLDLLRDRLPPADLVLCRDCLVHLSFEHVALALANIRESGNRYLLTTTFIGHDRNDDILTGLWRPINLQRPPFNFPEPLRLIDEESPLADQRDKRLGLWKTEAIPAG